MLIRDITAADLGAIHAINEAGAPGVHSESAAQLAAITRESCIAIVAEIGGVVAGFCHFLPPGATYQSMNYQWFLGALRRLHLPRSRCCLRGAPGSRHR